MVQKIRSQYTEKTVGELDLLRELDKKVKRPVNVFSYIFGSISAIIMGCGMSLIMTDIAEKLNLGDMFIPGIIIGVVGLALAAVNYPLNKALVEGRKKKYAPEILALSEKLLLECDGGEAEE